MDENSTEPPPSTNKNSPTLQVESGHLSTSQKLKGHDIDPTITSPRRPLSDTTKSTINSPKQKSASWKDISNDKELHTDGSDIQTTSSSSDQLARKLRHNSQHLLSKVGSDDDGDNSKTRHSSKGLQQPPESSHLKDPTVTSAKMVEAIEAATTAVTAAEIASTTTDSTRYPMEEHNSGENSSDDLSVVDGLKIQLVDLNAALVVEQEKTAWMSVWASDMEQLIQNFKEIRDDVMDSVDILAEYEEVMLAFEHEKQQQAEVDYLMNLVAERLFEIEEARQQ